MPSSQHCCTTAGDKTHRQHKQREEKAVAAAAVLQAAVSNDDFASSINDLETSFGVKFQEFIAGKTTHSCGTDFWLDAP